MNHPDPKRHQIISFIKSAVRIAACICGIATGYIAGFAIGMLVAELIGVYEELV
jgi:tetrahydromethanopterin S-methyltransferase subunit F